MPSLETRIAALEVDTTPVESLTIFRRFMRPGQPPTELQGLKDNWGNEWQRQPGETEQALIDRASLEAWRNPWGVSLLVGVDWSETPGKWLHGGYMKQEPESKKPGEPG